MKEPCTYQDVIISTKVLIQNQTYNLKLGLPVSWISKQFKEFYCIEKKCTQTEYQGLVIKDQTKNYMGNFVNEYNGITFIKDENGELIKYSKKNQNLLIIENYTNVNINQTDGALGLGIIHNQQQNNVNDAFLDNFLKDNQLFSQFLISINEKDQEYNLILGFDENTSLQNQYDFDWVSIPKNKLYENFWHLEITNIFVSQGDLNDENDFANRNRSQDNLDFLNQENKQEKTTKKKEEINSKQDIFESQQEIDQNQIEKKEQENKDEIVLYDEIKVNQDIINLNKKIKNNEEIISDYNKEIQSNLGIIFDSDNTQALNDINAILSLSNSYIALPQKYILRILKNTKKLNITCEIQNNGTICKDFNKVEDINILFLALQFKGQEKLHIIQYETLVKSCKQNEQQKFDCHLKIYQSLDDNVILGEPFFKNYKIGFDLNSKKIGIVKTRKIQETIKIKYKKQTSIPLCKNFKIIYLSYIKVIGFLIYCSAVYIMVKTIQFLLNNYNHMNQPKIRLQQNLDQSEIIMLDYEFKDQKQNGQIEKFLFLNKRFQIELQNRKKVQKDID